MHLYRIVLPKFVWQCSLAGVYRAQHDTSFALCPVHARVCCSRRAQMSRGPGSSRAVRARAVRCARAGALARRGSSNSASPTLASLKGHTNSSHDQILVGTRQHLPQVGAERIETRGRVRRDRGEGPLATGRGQLRRYADTGWSQPLTWAVCRPLQPTLMELLRPSERPPVAQPFSLRSPSEAALQRWAFHAPTWTNRRPDFFFAGEVSISWGSKCGLLHAPYHPLATPPQPQPTPNTNQH